MLKKYAVDCIMVQKQTPMTDLNILRSVIDRRLFLQAATDFPSTFFKLLDARSAS